jgi:hypothetical protein
MSTNQPQGVSTYKQWTLTTDSEEYRIENLDPSGGPRRFYMIKMGAFGQPVIVAEPDRAFEAPTNLVYVDAKGNAATPSERIAGVICQDGPRLSLSNAAKQSIEVHPNEDGSVTVGSDVWWIATLFQKDKNRIIGYDAYLRRDRPETVRILELGDLDLF